MKLSEEQQNLLVYLSFSDKPLGAQELGRIVGEKMRTNEDAQVRGSEWSSPKLQSLKTHGLVCQTSSRKYYVSSKGTRRANIILWERKCSSISQDRFLGKIHRDFEGTCSRFTSWLISFEELFNKLKKIFT